MAQETTGEIPHEKEFLFPRSRVSERLLNNLGAADPLSLTWQVSLGS